MFWYTWSHSLFRFYTWSCIRYLNFSSPIAWISSQSYMGGCSFYDSPPTRYIDISRLIFLSFLLRRTTQFNSIYINSRRTNKRISSCVHPFTIQLQKSKTSHYVVQSFPSCPEYETSYSSMFFTFHQNFNLSGLV